MSENQHEEDHSGPIKTPKQLLLAVFFSFVAPVFIIIGLVYYVTSHNKTAPGEANPEKGISERIQKVGSVPEFDTALARVGIGGSATVKLLDEPSPLLAGKSATLVSSMPLAMPVIVSASRKIRCLMSLTFETISVSEYASRISS